MGLRPHAPQGEPVQLNQPSRISATTHGNGASPFHISALPTSLQRNVASSVNPWLEDFCSASLQLFIQVDCLYFSFNSNLVLGAGECTLHLLHHHLGSLLLANSLLRICRVDRKLVDLSKLLQSTAFYFRRRSHLSSNFHICPPHTVQKDGLCKVWCTDYP